MKKSYNIPNFSKGLVSQESQGRLTDDYKLRCADLENFYIHKSDNIRIRPPAKLEDIEIPEDSSILEYKILSDNTIVHIREMSAEDILAMSVEERRQFFRVARDGSDQQLRDTVLFIDDETLADFKKATDFAIATDQQKLASIRRLLEPRKDSTDELARRAGRAFTRNISTLSEPNTHTPCRGELEYKAYVLQVGDQRHNLFVQRFVPESGNANDCIDYNVFEDMVLNTIGVIKVNYEYAQLQSCISIDGTYGQDSISKIPYADQPLAKLKANPAVQEPTTPLKIDWDNILTRFELYKDEITFNFANQHLKVTDDKELINLDSNDIVTAIGSDHDLESKLLPTDDQLWELNDLPIKVLQIDATGFDYDTERNTYIRLFDLKTGLESSASLGTDTRASGSDSTNVVVAPDSQEGLAYIDGSGPYLKAPNSNYDETTARYRSSNPMGFYKPSSTLTRDGVQSVQVQYSDTEDKFNTIKTLDRFLRDSNPNIARALDFLSPCITHYQDSTAELNSPTTKGASYNLFADIKVTQADKNYYDWTLPLFHYFVADVPHYVFAVPNNPSDVLTSELSSPGEDIFQSGNGTTPGGLGVRFEVQTGNNLRVEGDHSTATYNKLGNFYASGIVAFDNTPVPLANAQSKGETKQIFYMFYDYADSAVRNALADVEYIGAVINDGERLFRTILTESSDEFKLIENNQERHITDGDILRNIHYAKYPRLQARPVRGGSGDDDNSYLDMIVYRYAYSVLPYFLPDEVLNSGKRYIADKNSDFIKSTSVERELKGRDGESFSPYTDDGKAVVNVGILRPLVPNAPDDKRWCETGITQVPVLFMVARGFHLGRNLMRVNRSGTLSTVTYGENIEHVQGSSDNSKRSARYVERMFGLVATGNPDAREPGIPPGQTHRLDVTVTTDRSVILNPTFLRTKRQTPKQLVGGAVIAHDNEMNTSRAAGIGRESNRELFADTVANYLDARPNANVSAHLATSGIPLNLANRSSGANLYTFLTPRGQPDNFVDIVDDQPQIVIGLENSIRTLSGFGVAQEEVISNAGTTTELATESRYVLGANKDDIFQLSYYREAGGYVHNVINTDLNPGDRFDMIAGLFGRHKLYFFGQEGEREIYALAMGQGRAPKGVSKLTFDFPIHEIFHFTQDKLALRSDNRIYTLDFSKEAYEEDGSLVEYRDDGSNDPISTAVQTLPIVTFEDSEMNIFNRTRVQKAVIVGEGFMDIDFKVVDANRSLGQAAQATSEGAGLRLTNPTDISKTVYKSGVFPLESVRADSMIAPAVRIEKKTSSYLSLASLILSIDVH